MLYAQSPNSIDVASSAMRLFLAGSIDSGMAEDWQTSTVDRLRDLDVVVFNPRRAAWPAGASLESGTEELRRQINRELDAIERSDLMAFYFVPGTKAPISLLEHGLIAPRKQAVVCRPPGFWRKTNVDVICERFEIQQVNLFKPPASPRLIRINRSRLFVRPFFQRPGIGYSAGRAWFRGSNRQLRS